MWKKLTKLNKQKLQKRTKPTRNKKIKISERNHVDEKMVEKLHRSEPSQERRTDVKLQDKRNIR